MWDPKGTLTLVLPAYNEEDDLPRLLERIDETLRHDARRWQVIVVDDGSTDRTADIVRRCADSMPIRLIRHDRNRGLPAALSTGMLAALSTSDTIVTLDADDTQDPALIPWMVSRLATGLDVVIASRFAPGGEEVGVPAHRRALSRGAGMTLGILAPVPGVRDYSCGYRAYRSGILRQVVERFGRGGLVSEVGFACMVELLLKASELGARVGEVPLALRYDRKAGRSKMRIVRTSLCYGSVLYGHRRRRLGAWIDRVLPQTARGALVRRGSQVVGAVALAAALPVLLVAGILLRVFSRGPILIRETRIGPDRRVHPPSDLSPRRRQRDLGGQPFEAVRFRVPEPSGPAGPLIRGFRRLRLDRLPRLLNVVRGETHVVGRGRRSSKLDPSDAQSFTPDGKGRNARDATPQPMGSSDADRRVRDPGPPQGPAPIHRPDDVPAGTRRPEAERERAEGREARPSSHPGWSDPVYQATERH